MTEKDVAERIDRAKELADIRSRIDRACQVMMALTSTVAVHVGRVGEERRQLIGDSGVIELQTTLLELCTLRVRERELVVKDEHKQPA